MLSNTYNERYTKENIHRQRRNRQCGKKQTNEKKIMCTYNNETSKDYKQYTILSMIILLPIILIKMNENAGVWHPAPVLTPVLIMRRTLISAAWIFLSYLQTHVKFRRDVVLLNIPSAHIQQWIHKHSVSFSSLPSDINTELLRGRLLP